ncbi:hypothetical protein BOTBODRAFT_557547 [Botryobasidium botryosum FD-172 SS1]|uniref:Uncharacterized protein n=1 Tax=Botryobasidium botryosum (strain FD-172 SS1) TaxID=930990 RepID=A0A067M067_BOTB1|nr:hypothetical protein BOTBODRAFT_557547 [Botryobasidium botryosum FD-172 SS1]
MGTVMGAGAVAETRPGMGTGGVADTGTSAAEPATALFLPLGQGLMGRRAISDAGARPGSVSPTGCGMPAAEASSCSSEPPGGGADAVGVPTAVVTVSAALSGGGTGSTAVDDCEADGTAAAADDVPDGPASDASYSMNEDA